jgi:hypothetical protein
VTRLASVEVTAQFYDSTGSQLATGFDSTSDLAPERTWSFRINFVGNEQAVVEYDLLTDVTRG